MIQDSKLTVYPNPNNGVFQVDNTLGDLAIENIRIISALGPVVFEQKQNIPAGHQINLNTDLAAGLYYLEFKTNDNRRIIRKVVIE